MATRRYRLLSRPIDRPFEIFLAHGVGEVFEADLSDAEHDLYVGGGALEVVPDEPKAPARPIETVPKPVETKVPEPEVKQIATPEPKVHGNRK